jgi:thiamine-phosphate pyrophosphorylase
MLSQSTESARPRHPKRRIPKGLYGIVTESLCANGNVLQTAEHMLGSGVQTIQYREKHGQKDTSVMLEECKALRQLTKSFNALLIINDYPSLAGLCDADGVHIGQADWSVEEARALLGDRIVGVSTHNPEQAKEAYLNGADYIGVGPIYSTDTKPQSTATGLSYLEFVLQNIPIPGVAIGGIKRHNIEAILEAGAQHICLVTEITHASNPGKLMAELQTLMKPYLTP